jgi:hypothetical protein
MADLTIDSIDPASLARLHAAVGGLPGERDVIAAQLQRMDAAAAEPGLCGRIRRAVKRAKTPIARIASAARIPPLELQAFLEGTRELDSSQFGRLADALTLTLVYDPLAVQPVAQ